MEILFRGLTPALAEEALSEIWISIERLGVGSPQLRVRREGGRLRVCVRFDSEAIGFAVLRCLPVRFLPIDAAPAGRATLRQAPASGKATAGPSLA